MVKHKLDILRLLSIMAIKHHFKKMHPDEYSNWVKIKEVFETNELQTTTFTQEHVL